MLKIDGIEGCGRTRLQGQDDIFRKMRGFPDLILSSDCGFLHKVLPKLKGHPTQASAIKTAKGIVVALKCSRGSHHEVGAQSLDGQHINLNAGIIIGDHRE